MPTAIHSELQAAFGGDIVTPESPDYNEAITRWAANSTLPAAYVLYPKRAEDVTLAIKFATSHKLSIAVKGGGHSTSGASSVEGGVVIDLSRYFNTARIDEEKKLGYVGGGALWETVDNAAIKYGLATVCGAINHVGVGGLTLGGGYGLLSGEHGLAVDNVHEVTIVTADGQILKANETENSDLFWAIRGGGCNFGVVVEFVLRLHPQRATVFGGIAVFPGAMSETVCGVLSEMWKDASPKQAAHVYITSPPPVKQQITIVLIFFNGSESEGKTRFKPLFDLGPISNTCAEIPYEKLNTLLNPLAVPGYHIHTSSTSRVITTNFLSGPLYERLAALNSNDHEISYMVMFDFLTPDAIMSREPDCMAFASRGPQGNISLSGSWKQTPSTSSDVYERVTKGVAELKEIAVSRQNFRYTVDENSGYSGFETNRDDAEKAFKAHYPKLQKIKAKYDPENVFARWYPITPADSVG